MTTGKLDARGERNLLGVHPKLVAFARRVAELSQQPITIVDGGGLRSKAQAQANASRGTGLADSLHCKQPSGYAEAVDLVATIDGKPSWRRELYDEIRRAALIASAELSLPVQHGADWDSDGIPGEAGEWDWPHWQLPRWPAKIAAATALMLATRKAMGLE